MNLEDYLNSNISNPKEISNTTSFYDNFNKLSVLYNSITVKDKLLRCQGRYNSQICFIFKDEEHFKSCDPSLQRILPIYGAKIWDVLILYKNKTNTDNDINILYNELTIINPKAIYVFDDNQLCNDLQKPKNDVILGSMFIEVNNINAIVDKNISTEIFDLFEHIITYNY